MALKLLHGGWHALLLFLRGFGNAAAHDSNVRFFFFVIPDRFLSLAFVCLFVLCICAGFWFCCEHIIERFFSEGAWRSGVFSHGFRLGDGRSRAFFSLTIWCMSVFPKEPYARIMVICIQGWFMLIFYFSHLRSLELRA